VKSTRRGRARDGVLCDPGTGRRAVTNAGGPGLTRPDPETPEGTRNRSSRPGRGDQGPVGGTAMYFPLDKHALQPRTRTDAETHAPQPTSVGGTTCTRVVIRGEGSTSFVLVRPHPNDGGGPSSKAAGIPPVGPGPAPSRVRGRLRRGGDHRSRGKQGGGHCADTGTATRCTDRNCACRCHQGRNEDVLVLGRAVAEAAPWRNPGEGAERSRSGTAVAVCEEPYSTRSPHAPGDRGCRTVEAITPRRAVRSECPPGLHPLDRQTVSRNEKGKG